MSVATRSKQRLVPPYSFRSTRDTYRAMTRLAHGKRRDGTPADGTRCFALSETVRRGSGLCHRTHFRALFWLKAQGSIRPVLRKHRRPTHWLLITRPRLLGAEERRQLAQRLRSKVATLDRAQVATLDRAQVATRIPTEAGSILSEAEPSYAKDNDQARENTRADVLFNASGERGRPEAAIERRREPSQAERSLAGSSPCEVLDRVLLRFLQEQDHLCDDYERDCVDDMLANPSLKMTLPRDGSLGRWGLLTWRIAYLNDHPNEQAKLLGTVPPSDARAVFEFLEPRSLPSDMRATLRDAWDLVDADEELTAQMVFPFLATAVLADTTEQEEDA